MSLMLLFYLLFPIALLVAIIASIVMLINAILKNNTKKIKKMAIVIALLLTPIAYHYAKIAFYNSNSTPDINPHPTLKMRVYGDYPFEKDTNMKIGIRFQNKNKNCNRDKWLLDDGGSRHKIKTFPTTIKNGKFESIIYFDSYLPGICQWEAEEIYAYMQSKNDNIELAGEMLVNAKKDVTVSWDSDCRESALEGQIMFSFPLTDKSKYEKLFPKKVNFPDEANIGFVSQKAPTEKDKLLYINCFKKKDDNVNFKTKTILECNEFYSINGEKLVNGLKNISTTQKEVQVNFLDKGWRDQ